MTLTIHHGDNLQIMADMIADGSRVHAIVTDSPYGLCDNVDALAVIRAWMAGQPYLSRRRGFMGLDWDSMVPGPECWRLAYQLLPPGGHVITFAGTRTADLMALSLRIAGFEFRDTVCWMYGKGWPKSRAHLKPAWEPALVFRKPLEGTLEANLAAHGVGILNIDECRIPTAENLSGGTYSGRAMAATSPGWRMANGARAYVQPSGRWPANVVHDGGEEVLACFPVLSSVTGKRSERSREAGSPARFFYSAKASKADRAGSKHPTVKPVALMRWLCRLVTPPGGTILDPFAGSGTTGQAAIEEGMRAVLIEREDKYAEDIRRRFAGSAAGAADFADLCQ